MCVTITDFNGLKDLEGQVLAFTGHRPPKLGGYGSQVQEALVTTARGLLRTVKPKECIVGMALGWDQAVAQACINEKVPFAAYVPFNNYYTMWPERSQVKYKWLLERASRTNIVCHGGYSPRKMGIRNEVMVDHSEAVIALWDYTSGGTENCVIYAARVGKPTYNIWPVWSAQMDKLGVNALNS
jgi:uncharacterized phage-like protein YoqJ